MDMLEKPRSHGNVVIRLWDLRAASIVDRQQKARTLNDTGAEKLILATT